MTTWANEPYLAAKTGGQGHEPSHVGRRRYPGADLGVRRKPLAPILCVGAAWGALLLSGLSLALTGEFSIGPLYGERMVFAAALGAASFALWGLGERTQAERIACLATLACSLLALALFPAGSRLEFYGAIGLVHAGLCAQLAAWAIAARKTQRVGLLIILAGMAAETFVILPIAQLRDVAADCTAGMRATCIAGSPFVGIALPLLITLALVLLWLRPLERRLRSGRGER